MANTKDLKSKLEEAQKAEAKKRDSKPKSRKENKEAKKIIELKNKLAELEEVSKRAQFDYINLKSDFDILQRRNQENEKNMKTDILISNFKKFVPFLEELRKILENTPKDQKNNPITKWLELSYNKFLKNLETMHITPIESIGLVPDSLIHEPVSMAPADDKKMKGKIIQEFEKGFIYSKSWETKVISTSKVIVWQ